MARRRRYSGGYGSGYQDPEDSMAQGGAFYNPYSPGIDWGMGLRNTLENLASKMEQKRKEKLELQQQDFENKIAEREIATREKEADYRLRSLLNKPEKEPTEKEYTRNILTALVGQNLVSPEDATYWEFNGKLPEGHKFGPPKKEEKIDKPDVFDKKMAGLNKLLKEGKITQAQFDAAKVAAYGVDTPTSPDPLKLVHGRNENDRFVRQWINSFKDKDGKVSSDKRIEVARGMFKVTGSEPVSTEGFRLDMPATYNVAKKNIEDGIDRDGEAGKTIEKYDAMFDWFKREALPHSWEDFVKSPHYNNPRIDKRVIYEWFKIYK